MGRDYDAVAISDALRNAVNNVYHDVVSTGRIDPVAHPEEYGAWRQGFFLGHRTASRS